MKLRKIIQIVFFALILAISVGHTLEEHGIVIPLISSASLHAVCPLGGAVLIYKYFVSCRYVKKVHESSFVLMFIVLGLSVIFGPVFCGWICPMGTFQEWLSKIGRKIFKKKYNTFIPYKVDKYLRYIRYIVIVMVLVKTAQSAILVFAEVDPYYALFNIWTDEVAIGGYISLALVILLSMFVERPFCKYACPYGALLGITNLFRPVRIKREASTCISCSLCDKKCPMNIPLSKVDVSRDHQCISCMECTSEAACPKADTMTFSLGKKIVKAKTVAIAAVLFFVVGVGGSMALDLWATENSKEPTKYSEGEFKGTNNPADIRGSYSMQDIEDSFGVPVEIIAKAFNLGDITNPAAFKCKDMEGRLILEEGMGDIGTDSFKVFVALYKSLPIEAEEGTALLPTAYDILKDRVSGKELEYLESIVLNKMPEMNPNPDDSHEEEEKEQVINGDFEIKGNTTFKDVLNAGFSENDLSDLLGVLPSDLNEKIKDYAVREGVEFSTIKEGLLGSE